MSFGSDIQKYAKKLDKSLDEVVYEICSETSEKIINRTPYDKGYAKDNWIATIDNPSNTVSNSKDISGMVAIGKAKIVARKAKGHIFYLSNNLPYIRKLEFGGYAAGPKIVGGFSTQAPHGMVRITLKEIKAKMKRYK